jgi:FAD/FMN-containing dehydrogenase
MQPAAITYPKTPQEVSNIVKMGAAQGMRVVARSGGVSCFFDSTY